MDVTRRDETTPAKDILPGQVAEAIYEVLRYLWQDEIESFMAHQPGTDEPHIFRALATIDGWFYGHEASAEELARDSSSDRETGRVRG